MPLYRYLKQCLIIDINIFFCLLIIYPGIIDKSFAADFFTKFRITRVEISSRASKTISMKRHNSKLQAGHAPFNSKIKTTFTNKSN